ncbi:MAG TPA: hypothetical protein VER17_15455 [Tepidisphaeraceae bacterium]|nr:hypothetical protein [Tepidisphaeraceae bacterium]
MADKLFRDMLRSVGKIFGLTFLLLAASGAVFYYQRAYSTSFQIAKLQDEKRKAEEEKRQLEQVVSRLSTEKRVADVLVSRQEKNADGVLETTLLLVEYDKQGSPLPAKSVTVLGEYVHIDAMVIKFDHDLVRENDPLRGHSIALFTKIYGDHQRPADAQMIDPPGRIPDIYRGAEPQVSEFEMSLWKEFWRLYEDESFRKSKGVRTASGHGLWGIFRPDRLYTVTIEPDGGLSLASEGLKGIYREALKQRFAPTPATGPAAAASPAPATTRPAAP